MLLSLEDLDIHKFVDSYQYMYNLNFRISFKKNTLC